MDREWAAGGTAEPWIRRVSKRVGQEVSEYERQYEDGSDPWVLDILNAPVKGPTAGLAMRKLVDRLRILLQKMGSSSSFDLPALVDQVEPRWLDGDGTYSGMNDRIASDQYSENPTSLRFIRVEDLELKVFSPGEAFGNSKRRVQGWFIHANRRYGLWVTDPVYERQYLSKLNGTYQIGACYITVSLGEEFQGYLYKLIAAIVLAEG